ncbi:hypothetical protein [Jannaschia marina]|uniref:hypothetical protein n=1 Tax=Jannaschia marina TaxID=2741674 RepID=UPI0015C7F265|nr:hypothetical protein [Jannaschia marina]
MRINSTARRGVDQTLYAVFRDLIEAFFGVLKNTCRAANSYDELVTNLIACIRIASPRFASTAHVFQICSLREVES